MKEHRRSLPTTENRTKVIAKRFSCCLIFAVVFALPAKDSKGEEKYSQNIRDLTRIHYARARNYYRKGEYSKAKAEFQQVLKLAPEHQGACWYLKNVEKELAKYRNRKTFWGRRKKRKGQDLKPASEVEPIKEDKEKEKLEEIKQLYEKGKIYFRRGLYPEAMACFEKVIELGESP